MTENQHPRRGRKEWAFNFERKGRTSTSTKERDEIRSWFAGSLVEPWFVGAPKISVDDYEIQVLGSLPAIDGSVGTEGEISHEIAEVARIERFREDTRLRRMQIAADAEARFSRKVSWGAQVGSTSRLFTTASVPVMTRLQLDQRRTLDTLVESGVARSKSDALAWCVELVARNEDQWISRLRDALDSVEVARGDGPSVNRG